VTGGAPSGATDATANSAAVSAPVQQANLLVPLSMVTQPESHNTSADASKPPHFLGELDLSFDAALGRLGIRSAQDKVTFRDVAFDGFRQDSYESKRERDRRYGAVYTVAPLNGGYFIRLEMPRTLPRSSLSAAWGRRGPMPDYRYSITLTAGSITIRASVADEKIRRLAYISRSFPADFLTRISIPELICGFVHRLKDKVLEIVALKDAARDRGHVR
jgi:hypothetical protein